MNHRRTTAGKKSGAGMPPADLTAKDVLRWFDKARGKRRWPLPDEQQLTQLCYQLNLCKNIPHFITVGPSVDYLLLPKRNQEKVAKAATDLIRYLPDVIDCARTRRESSVSQGVENWIPASFIEKLETLLQSAKALPSFYRNARKPDVRSRWHEAAFIIWSLTQEAWHKAGKEPQSPAPTSPSVVVTASALEWLGLPHEVETIWKVLVKLK